MTNAAYTQFGRDFYVRLTIEQARLLKWEHISTEVYARSPDHSACGSTEWISKNGNGVHISIAWDWICMSDGKITFDSKHSVRSNIMIIDDSGYDLGPKRSDEMLARIPCATPWQAMVCACLHRESGC